MRPLFFTLRHFDLVPIRAHARRIECSAISIKPICTTGSNYRIISHATAASLKTGTLERSRPNERERERGRGGEEITLCAVNRGRSAILSESQTSVRRDPRSSSADISFSPARILPSFLPPPPLTPLLLLLLIESGRILVNFREEVLYKCRRIIQRPVSIHSAP